MPEGYDMSLQNTSARADSGPGCPYAHGKAFDPLDPEQVANPYRG